MPKKATKKTKKTAKRGPVPGTVIELILKTLKGKKRGMRPTDIAKAIKKDPPNVSRTLQTLKKKRKVKSIKNPDDVRSVLYRAA